MPRLRARFCLATVLLVLSTVSFLAGPAHGQEADGEDEVMKRVPYGTDTWDTKLGNHRALIRVTEKADAVRVQLPWRRRDRDPQKKHVVILDAKTHRPIPNVKVLAVDADLGDIVFQPAAMPGDYCVYYLPYAKGGGGISSGGYEIPSETADAAWLKRHGLDAGPAPDRFPFADVVEFQARSDFHRLDPMELPATRSELDALIARHPGKAYLVFTEDRRNPIRMPDALPLCWVDRGPSNVHAGEALRYEYYAFQIGCYAVGQDLEDLRITFRELRTAEAAAMSASA
ncbi:MAG: hypothetical protein GY851_35040, partial [bacterium]|nr:hypothetical protein [bacterium]